MEYEYCWNVFNTSLLDSNERLNSISSCDWRVFFINIAQCDCISYHMPLLRPGTAMLIRFDLIGLRVIMGEIEEGIRTHENPDSGRRDIYL